MSDVGSTVGLGSTRSADELQLLLRDYVAAASAPGPERDRLDTWAPLRSAARRHWEELLDAERFGRDVSESATWKLIAHADGALAQRHGAFVHPLAPAVDKDLHLWFETAGWVRREQWPELGRGLFDLVLRCTDHPNELWPAMEAFLAVPGASAFTAEMIAPILHALRPTEFVLLDAECRTLLNHATGSAFGNSLRDFPAAHAAARRLLAELRPALAASALCDRRPEDVLEGFSHWMVHVRLMRRESGAEAAAPRAASNAVGEKTSPAGENAMESNTQVQPDEPAVVALTPEEALAMFEAARNGGSAAAAPPVVIESMPAPASELPPPVIESMPAPVVEPMPAAVAEEVVAEPVVEPAAAPVIEAVAASNIEPAPAPVVEALAAPIAEPVAEPAPAPLAEAIAAPANEPVAVPEVPVVAPAELVMPCSNAPPEPEAPMLSSDAVPAQVAEPSPEMLASPAMPAPAPPAVAATLFDAARAALERRGQIVLAGPPGSGKSHLARRLAEELARSGDGFVEHVVLHSGWRYADFVQATEPDGSRRPGLFASFCRQAAARRGPCVLVVDDAERGTLPEILGEALTLLDRRGLQVALPGGGSLCVPPNARLIFTLDDTSRSGRMELSELLRNCAVLRVDDEDELRRRHPGAAFVEPLLELRRALAAEVGDPHRGLPLAFFLRARLPDELPSVWHTEVEPFLAVALADEPARAAAFRWEAVASRLGC